MSDVDGIYDRPPSSEGARVLNTFVPEDLGKVTFGAKSDVGTGGMESKVKSALWALEHGSSVVICNGMRHNSIRKIIDGQKIGTFFTQATPDATPVDILAKNGNQTYIFSFDMNSSFFISFYITFFFTRVSNMFIHGSDLIFKSFWVSKEKRSKVPFWTHIIAI